MSEPTTDGRLEIEARFRMPPILTMLVGLLRKRGDNLVKAAELAAVRPIGVTE